MISGASGALPSERGALRLSGSAAGALLGAGSLAAGGIAICLIVSGGVNLPALPGIDVAAVCNLPQEGIDFLKGAGSMEPQECLPEEQN